MVISYFRIFRYGSCLEIAVTVLGIFLGMLSSLGISYNFVQIGELSTSFIERTAYPQKLSSYLPLTQAFGGGRQLVNASHAENMAALIEDAKAMAIGMFITIAISILLCIGSIELTEWSSLRQITRIRMLFLQSLLRQDMTWFDTDTEFNLASSMSENLAKLKEGMGEKLGIVANLVGTALLCFSAALPLGWELCLACFAVTPFSLLACVVLSNYQTKSSKKQMESYSQAGKQAEEVLKSVKTVVAFAGENKEVDRHQRLLLPAMRYGQKKGFYTGLGNGFNWLLTYSLNAIGLSYGTRLVQRGDETPSGDKRYNFGTVFSILVTAYISTMSITQCVPHLEVFASASAAAAAIFELIDRKPKIDNLQESYHSLEGVKGDIIFEDVHFVYPSRPEVKVLKGLSMHVKSGENVALVGSSGCGKSTIIQVLQRLYDPIAGSVKLDGKDLKSINLSYLRSSLGVVGQEPALFRGTIHENIAIGRPKATREDVQRVAEMAYAHDFISRLANGYDTAIGERGASLSGGQKQRIAIARALLREPVILLLDEATSALDSHSERQVQAALDRASAGRTTIIVAHRLSTIVHAERIICLDKGVIVEQGNHVELMKAKGFYHNLVMRSNESHEPEESKSKVPESMVPESTVPEYTVPESMVPESTVPESTVPETTVPESRVPETMVPETTVPETTVPESTVSESTVPESTVPESRVPETTAPETTVPVTTIPETTVPESTLPESTGPESRVPEMTVPETTVPESTVPKLTVPESTVPEDHSSEKSPQIERTDKKNPPTIRLHRQISKRDSLNLTTPRDSIPITDVITTGNQNMCNSSVVEIEKEENEEIHDEEIKPISDWELMKLNAPEWMAITIGAIAAVIQGACFPVFAILFGYFSGIFAMPDQTNMVQLADLYSGICIVVAVIAGLCMCLQSVTFTSSGLKMSTRLRCQYFEALLRQEMAFYDKASNTVGAVCARLTGDTAEIQGATGLRIGIILQGISSVLIGVILAMFYNWKLALVSTALLPLMVGSIWLEGSMSKKSQADERAAMEDATAYATEAILSIKTVQSLGIEQLFLDKFRASLEIACAAVAKKSRFRGLVFGIGTYIPFMSYCSALVYGAVLVANGDIEYRVVLLVTQAIMYGAHILGQSLVFVPGFHSAKVCGARILHIIRREPAVKTEDKVKDNKDWAATGKFGLKDLEFSYPTRPNQKILHGINLKVEAGKTIAIVGSSGCGKSTILQLLQRFYDPDSGNIELDERDIRTGLTLPRLRRQLGVVQQEPVLFDRTIAENIAYGDNNREISMDEIVAAAKAANIHSFIISLPKGYETNLGSGGAQLSGGQKQRVCIARALIRSPRLLLLDEATSALDANSERVVADALDKAARGRTCITIAHRLSTIKDANLIFVLDKGRIVEKGTHSELISIKGSYWNLTRGHICLDK